MKNILLLLAIIFTSNVLMSQNSGSDIIFPTGDKPTIRDCKIIDVQHGNVVFYSKGGIEERIEALSIKKDGKFIDLTETSVSAPKLNTENNTNNNGLYKGYNYEYYHSLSRKARGTKSFGVIFTLLGLGAMVASSLNASDNGYASETDQTIYLAGFITFNIGIPLWISGGVKNKNNKKAMSRCQNPNYSVNLGSTQNGFGLVMRF